jgi:hypothetical protein
MLRKEAHHIPPFFKMSETIKNNKQNRLADKAGQIFTSPPPPPPPPPPSADQTGKQNEGNVSLLKAVISMLGEFGCDDIPDTWDLMKIAMFALKKGYHDTCNFIANYLPFKGVDIMYHAILCDNPELSKCLMGRYGIHQRDPLGNTILHYAAWNGHFEMVKRITILGGNMHYVNNAGHTPLDAAIVQATAAQKPGYADIIRFFFQNLDVNQQDCNGNTLLHQLVASGVHEIIKLFLEVCPLHLENHEKMTPHDIAVQVGDESIITLLDEEIPRSLKRPHGGGEESPPQYLKMATVM